MLLSYLHLSAFVVHLPRMGWSERFYFLDQVYVWVDRVIILMISGMAGDIYTTCILNKQRGSPNLQTHPFVSGALLERYFILP
jgi:hypothetical protein